MLFPQLILFLLLLLMISVGKCDTKTFKGSKIEAIASQQDLEYGKLLMNQFKFPENLCFVCNDLIFGSQPNFTMGLGIHQIVFVNLNLKVHFAAPEKQEVWHFENTNTDHVKRAINGFFGKGLLPTQIQLIKSIYLIKQLKITFKFHYS